MKTKHALTLIGFCLALSLCSPNNVFGQTKPSKLSVSANGHFLQYADGSPFFYLGDTGWLMPQRLNRDQVGGYLGRAANAGYNVVQVQVLNGTPSFNIYGKMSNLPDLDFEGACRPDDYGYWDHMDFIIDTANRLGIYIGMVCIWGNNVKAGAMNVEQAERYGKFLAERYKDRENIIWIIGGDIQGNIKNEEWHALARSIKAVDKNHLMTFHPRGRTTSAYWFANTDWLDFHMYQSGHRRYNQRMGNKDYPIVEGTEEDCWMYVDSVYKYEKTKPVLDGEPSYEDIPQGLHDADAPRWNDADVRRYAYWDVFAGCAGHCYGHNNIMQFAYPGTGGAYFADTAGKPWWIAQEDPGYNSMQYLKQLILVLPYFDRVADQSIVKNNGTKYHRLAATRGKDFLLVYNYMSDEMTLDLTKISGKKKNLWWMNAADGSLSFLGEYDSKTVTLKAPETKQKSASKIQDGVLIAIDASSPSYIGKNQENILQKVIAEKDRTE